MKNDYKSWNIKKCSIISLIIFLLLITVSQVAVEAQVNVPLRRPISTVSPMWLVHIDSWIQPDPQKVINLIPEDIRPYVVMNIALSTSGRVKYPFETAESWIRTCAENGIWAMIQPSSGYSNNFSNTKLEVYEYFYAKYPNFIG